MTKIYETRKNLETWRKATADQLRDELADLRKGRSRVLESGHTVILGWSPHVFEIIRELVLANENKPRSCIVLLADHDKVEMEDSLRDHLPDTGRTRVVCRRGSASVAATLR